MLALHSQVEGFNTCCNQFSKEVYVYLLIDFCKMADDSKSLFLLTFHESYFTVFIPVQLRISRRDPRPDVVLSHLLEIKPSPEPAWGASCAPLMPADQSSEPSGDGGSSRYGRGNKPLPPVSLLKEFCADFGQSTVEALKRHFRLLMAPHNFEQTQMGAQDESSKQGEDSMEAKESSEGTDKSEADKRKMRNADSLALYWQVACGSMFRSASLLVFMMCAFCIRSIAKFRLLFIILILIYLIE